MRKHKILYLFLLCALFLGSIGVAPTHAASPIVRAVLFFLPTCSHCEYVIKEVLPPLQKEYKEQFIIAKIDLSTPAGQQLYEHAIAAYQVPDNRLGVPALVVGADFLVGDQEIPDKLPGLIKTGLSEGGVNWPTLPGLNQITSTLEDANDLNQNQPFIDSMLERFQRDRVGNSLAVAVLLGMIISLLFVIYNYVTGSSSLAKPWPGWVIPLLATIGMLVAIYLTFVETTKTQAFCGPIGDCNSVQSSPYAKIFGFLPVGILGLMGYAAILVLWVLQAVAPEKWRKFSWLAIWGSSIFGVLFSIYLTFLEPFIIGATCIWCITSAIVITLLLWASTPLAKLASSSEEQAQGDATPASGLTP